MYAALWRSLPGPWPVRLILLLALIALALWALATYVFPWVEEMTVREDVTIDTGS